MSLIVAAVLVLASQAAVEAPAQAVKEKKVCRKDQSTVSRMTKVTCHTRAEWVEIDKLSDEDADRLRKDSRLKSQ